MQVPARVMVLRYLIHYPRLYLLGSRQRSRYWTLVICLLFLNIVMIFLNGVEPWKQLYKDLLRHTSQERGHQYYTQIQATSWEEKRFDRDSGIRVAGLTRNRCAVHKWSVSSDEETFWLGRMHSVSHLRHLYCPVEKVGTTFWRRVLYLINRPQDSYSQPYQVPIGKALLQQYEPLPYNYSSDYKDYFKFIFVRNPYSRILSAYIDKVFVPNPLFWKRFGRPSIRMFRSNASNKSMTCGHDPSFREFVKFVVWSERRNKMRDLHFMKTTDMCLPCVMNFTFVGKMETFKQDAFWILHNLGLSSVVEELERDLDHLAADDAILDSILSPFSWKKNIVSCMSWDEALRRIWRKLQLRGLVSLDIKYPLDPRKAAEVTPEQFISLARQAHQASKPDELKSQKRSVFRELYRTVPLEDLVALMTVYKADFDLFGYDDSPTELFDRFSVPVTYRKHSYLEV